MFHDCSCQYSYQPYYTCCVSAGDHIKFNFPMAFSVTSLAWGLLEFKDAYEDAGELDHMYDCIKWPLDYLMKCHVSPNVYYVQVKIP